MTEVGAMGAEVSTMASPTNVVDLRGTAHALPNAPCVTVVEFLKELLAHAEAGEVRSIALVYVRGNGRPVIATSFGDGNFFALHSGVHLLADDLTRELNAPESCRDLEPIA